MGDSAKLEYISIGGNRHPSAADWSANLGGILAYGAGNSIALWRPSSEDDQGVIALLNGHADTVNAVKFISTQNTDELAIVSASADKTVRYWEIGRSDLEDHEFSSLVIGNHDASVTTLAVEPVSQRIYTAGADRKIHVWRKSTKILDHSTEGSNLVETIPLKIMPLAIAVHQLTSTHTVLAVAGSSSSIYIYITQSDNSLGLVATLAGHAGWIRSLSFVGENEDANSDLLLASTSQDKFIRIWRIHKGDALPTTKAVEDPSLGVLGRSVSTKAHRFDIGSEHASVTFEALLLGHDDWVYSNLWHRHQGRLQLLSASADSSLAVWESDPSSGIWVCVSRLGEISAQKGSTTATGSTGGFWIGLWSPDGNVVASLGRTGSWRVWSRENKTWTPTIGLGGHIRSVSDIAWSPNGDYLLSTSTDQTTRLHAQWRKGEQSSWHEFARPQIHGYDLNCIAIISDTQFVSGAEEKPLRVFQEPAAVAQLLEKLCGIQQNATSLPDAANIPVLGLSNKAVQTNGESNTAAENEKQLDTRDKFNSTTTIHPPLEDDLSRHLLWPELHKIYGHGFEISAVSVTKDGTLMATACRASSIDHAVIRIYETQEWREFCAPLRAHTLTVTALEWSPDGRYLLSVSRDRMWSIFERTGTEFRTTTVKGHSRMILDCAWASSSAGQMFATAGRDKSVKIWQLGDDAQWQLRSTLPTTQPVTAIAFAATTFLNQTLAIGLEDGEILIGSMQDPSKINIVAISKSKCPSKTITTLAWRPRSDDVLSLAVASEDGSLRLIKL